MKISIITVVLNNKSYIEDCINSILEQSYDDVEYIVVDGGSTDGTVDIIKKYEKYISKWISEPDRGIYDAMNKGIKLASGEVVGILNSDDFYTDQTILSEIASTFHDERLDSCYGDLVYVRPHNKEHIFRAWHAGQYHIRRFYRGWMPPHPSFFVKKACYEKYGYFNLDMGTAADYELMLRFLLKNRISSYNIPKVLVRMRSGGISNSSIKNRIAASQKDLLAWKVNDLKPYPWTIYMKPLSKIGQFFQQ
jgi:glycosyltransferase involved in cell wall biosynthesis